MEGTEIRITKRKLKNLVNDNIRSAEAVNLIYVSDCEPGIRRLEKDGLFIYTYKGKTVSDKDTLQRIKSLVIPPAWKDVWICASEIGHLQVTGLDAKHRKQYKYHPLWNALRNHTKYFHLYDFGNALPSIREQLKIDLAKQGLPQEKVLAAVVSLMQCTCIRIGNNVYEKLNGSFGLTTLKDQHVRIKGQEMKFAFKGKKGVYHNITLKSKKLAKIVQACKDIPGKELFQYYDENGGRKSIDSGMVNSYIKTVSGGNFSAKDFRTWEGTLHALNAFKVIGPSTTQKETKKRIVEALDLVAAQLGNTRTVCKKYYVHPAIIDLYTAKRLEKYFSQMDKESCPDIETSLSHEEKIVMKILETYGGTVIM